LRGAADRLRVDLSMVSHIDDDHIAGMVQLTRKLREIKEDNGVPFLDIRRFWFNSFSALVGTLPEPAQKLATLAASDDAALSAELPGIRHETAAVLSSVGQGEKLTAEIITLGLPLNERRGKPLAAPDTMMVNGAKVTILGPLQSRLDDLQHEWAKQAKTAAKPADLAGLFREDLDTSVPNLSSLVALVEIDGKRILLTGDARGDDIVKGWRAASRALDKPDRRPQAAAPRQRPGPDRGFCETVPGPSLCDLGGWQVRQPRSAGAARTGGNIGRPQIHDPRYRSDAPIRPRPEKSETDPARRAATQNAEDRPKL